VAELKTQPTDASVEAYLAAIQDETRREDCRTLVRWMREITSEKPVMWGTSIVGFGIYRYQYASGRSGEMPLVGFASRKRDLTLYIMTGFERYDALLARLGKFKLGKGCLYIKRLADVDTSVLRQLITESAQHMRATNRG
jgi:hypothetical protein